MLRESLYFNLISRFVVCIAHCNGLEVWWTITIKKNFKYTTLHNDTWWSRSLWGGLSLMWLLACWLHLLCQWMCLKLLHLASGRMRECSLHGLFSLSLFHAIPSAVELAKVLQHQVLNQVAVAGFRDLFIYLLLLSSYIAAWIHMFCVFSLCFTYTYIFYSPLR